jgi:NAD(P)-dependent dehydrogenase (short-subunit alcohol dehydrogenase family)
MQRSVIITGSAGGVGKYLVEKFKKANYYVIGVDIEKTTNCDLNIICDLSNVEYAPVLIKNHIDNYTDLEKIDCLINNAAIQILSNFTNTTYADFKKTLDVNLLSPFFITQTLKEYLKGGTIINISSIHANQSKNGFLMYATSKGALKTMTQNMALELATEIGVIGILPAAIDTPMLRSGLSEEAYEKLKEYHPTQSIGDPKDLAEFVLHISENNVFMTGTNIEWDGGISKALNDPE